MLTTNQQQHILTSMIEELLEQLGFSQKEIAVYLTVFRHGKTTPSSVAQITGINRATIYSVAKALQKKGVLSQHGSSKNTTFSALSPDKFSQLVQDKKYEISIMEDVVEKVQKQLNDMPHGIRFAMPEIKIIDEEHIQKFLSERVETWNKSVAQFDTIWWGFQDHTFVQHHKDWILRWFDLESSRRVSVRFLSNESEVEKRMQRSQDERRVIRFWGKSDDFTATVWVAGAYIIMIHTREHPHYLIEIKNNPLAHNMREVFKNLWREIT